MSPVGGEDTVGWGGAVSGVAGDDGVVNVWTPRALSTITRPSCKLSTTAVVGCRLRAAHGPAAAATASYERERVRERQCVCERV